MNLQHCLWTSCLWILFKSFFFLFYLKPWCTPVLVGLWYRVSLTLSSAGVKGVNLREICLFTTGQKTRGLQRDMLRRRHSARTPKCFTADLQVPTWERLFAVFACIMWFKGMFGTDWGKKNKKIPPLIAFHKCQENLQDRGLCDRATAEERLSGGGRRLCKKVTRFTGIVPIPDLTFSLRWWWL